MSKLIYLSPSNHGKNQNKCLHSGCCEDKHTRPIAEVCAKYLKATGFEVIVAEDGQNLAARVKEADSKNASLYVPIHTNASSSAAARYLLFMFYKDSADYRKIFNKVAPRLEAIYPYNSKSQFWARPKLYEVNRPKAKTLYCELGFHTNQRDCDGFIHNPEAVGKALAQGICDYYGVTLSGAAAPSASAVSCTKGTAVKLSSTPIYASSTAKTCAGRVSGTYYLWDGREINGRMRITNAKSRVGISGQVTGWINRSDL